MKIQGMQIDEFVARVKIGMINPANCVDEILSCLELIQDYDDIDEELTELKQEFEDLQAEKEEIESCLQNCVIVLDKPGGEQSDTKALTEVAKLLYECGALIVKSVKKGRN